MRLHIVAAVSVHSEEIAGTSSNDEQRSEQPQQPAALEMERRQLAGLCVYCTDRKKGGTNEKLLALTRFGETLTDRTHSASMVRAQDNE